MVRMKTMVATVLMTIEVVKETPGTVHGSPLQADYNCLRLLQAHTNDGQSLSIHRHFLNFFFGQELASGVGYAVRAEC